MLSGRGNTERKTVFSMYWHAPMCHVHWFLQWIQARCCSRGGGKPCVRAYLYYTIYNIIIHTVHTCMSCNHINISYYNLYIYLYIYIYNIIILYMHSNVQILPLNGINTLGQQVLNQLNQQWAANGPRCAVREKFGLSNQKSWKSKMLTKTVIGVT